MLADLGPAQPDEGALGLVVQAFAGESTPPMVDPVHLELVVRRIPDAARPGVDGQALLDATHDGGDGSVLCNSSHEGVGPGPPRSRVTTTTRRLPALVLGLAPVPGSSPA